MFKFNKTVCAAIVLAPFFIFLFYLPSHASNAVYGALPPFVATDAKPNVLLVIDYSGSMQFPAHYGENYSGYSSQVAQCGFVSANYDSSTAYYGYFDPDAYYSYDSNGYWQKDTTTTYKDREAGYESSLSGNLLNFLATSRVDAVLKNLIGGKADCPEGESYCLLRPQGADRTVTVPNLNLKCQISYTGAATYMARNIQLTVSDQGGTSSIGTFANRYARVKVDASERTGAIQANSGKVRFGLIVYASDGNSSARQGTIKYGVNEDDIDTLMENLEQTVPYQGTYTGEAMSQAYYYLTQASGAYWYNSSYISKGTVIDPYYELRDDGTLEPAWCRKSFVLLISDGEWGGYIDPDEWAHKLHSQDLRTDTTNFPGDQNAAVYSLFAFSSSGQGKNSMKTVAAFGNYNDIDGCSSSAPYSLNESANSRYNAFPTGLCDPSGTYNACCAEWDSDDRDGVPDAFYYASNGEAIEQALSDIFKDIRQGTSSGTAVTALTSKISSGNVVVQGAFYPTKDFDDGKSINWTGDVFAEWYLNGYYPDAGGVSTLVQNIREDTNSNYTLNVETDRILEYLIEDSSLAIDAYDSNSYGTKTDYISDQTYLSIEDAANLFDCGEQLRTRSPW